MLSVYFGSEQTPYTAAIGTKWMISAVARIMNPGCKADHLLVAEGPQGVGKSSSMSILAGDHFADTGITIGDKDSYQNLRRVWIYEFGELSSIKSAKDVERVKSFVSSRSDHYRPSYGKRALDFPRQCVFVGSTNESTYLADKTGNRRFWPFKCGNIDLKSLSRDRDQLWAEAMTRYQSNETWYIDTADLVAECREQQEAREQVDPWVQFASEWLSDPSIPDEGIGYPARTHLNIDRGITTADLLVGAIGMKRDRIDRAAETRAGQVLRHLGWERRQVRNGTQRAYRYFGLSLLVTTSAPEGGDTE
jgi:predicted P-loop ATPase